MLVPWALFGAFAALAWWGLDYAAAGKSRAVERLDELKEPRKRRADPGKSALKQTDTMTRMLEMATPALAKPLQPKKRGRAGQTEGQARQRRLPQARRPGASSSG